MGSLLKEIERTYVARCDNRTQFKDLWEKLSSEFSPDILGCVKTPRPSFFLARDAGDLGLAIMWIVQTAIVRPILNDIGIKEIASGEKTLAIAESSIGALAHSEEKNFPAIIKESAERIIISGKKKYITGGTSADFILITARNEGEEKTTKLIALPKEAIAPESFKNLSLPMLRTIEHASLELHDARITGRNLIAIEPSHLRRLLKKWSIMERAFIAEAFLGLCAYIAMNLEKLDFATKNLQDEIELLLKKIQPAVAEMLDTALNDEKIPELLPLYEIVKCYLQLKESIHPSKSVPPELALRLSDLALFEKMKS